MFHQPVGSWGVITPWTWTETPGAADGSYMNAQDVRQGGRHRNLRGMNTLPSHTTRLAHTRW
ncbi:hypothetical protein CONLIGDRAFT_497372 [Coniochaeta ligniaria NRRL 30616]|uniref:Uncharacterized protein n=1 Tax=Coniochaeta ligniaria NRRL 30616 TaxID=1408157 RepID=A0A1J7JD39_9PEZI|nr:hypothetical protein CONLIGDRAFT_497372 [Coniochaeta ligniaria NRRL 30616]